MARPRKLNADYFSHDADMRNDFKIKALRRKFSHMGYAVWCYLLETLTDNNNFELSYDEITVELLAADFDVETTDLKEIISYCLKIGLLQQEHNTLYSQTLKQRFTPLLDYRGKRRNNNGCDFTEDETASRMQNDTNGNNANVLPVQNPCKTQLSDVLPVQNSHSKVKKSRVKITPPISPSVGATPASPMIQLTSKQETPAATNPQSASGASTLAVEREPGHSPHTSAEPACETASPPAGSGQSPFRQRAPAARFQAPTVAEVADYCFQRNNGVDAEIFVNFYTAKDWMIGKNRMKDWRAAVRTWEKNHPLKSENQPTYQPKAIRL